MFRNENINKLIYIRRARSVLYQRFLSYCSWDREAQAMINKQIPGKMNRARKTNARASQDPEYTMYERGQERNICFSECRPCIGLRNALLYLSLIHI